MGDADGELLKGIGMNMVRLGVLITGTMPTDDGNINATYLTEAKDMVDTLNSHGIYTLIDGVCLYIFYLCLFFTLWWRHMNNNFT